MRFVHLVVLSLLAASVPARAQLLEKKSLSLEAARRVVAAAIEDAKGKAGTAVVAVVDDGGNLMALERLDGTFAAGAHVSIGKARTAALFKKPTRVFEEIIGKGRTAMVAVDDFTPLQGGVPIVIDGQIVGAVGVSGAASAAQDEEVAIAGANAVTSASAEPSAVRQLPGKEVQAAFMKGQPLIEQANYKIHASHRDGPGKVEVHLRDTDIIHVLKGSATLVVGGTVVDGSVTEPDEIRGASVKGGDTRKLAAGDVMVIPAGVPHWFEQVNGALDYYVVKVR
ncbi:MAG: heme-binding protein [Deltaproteobacteria bacterium]|nr:heme-binding protein [Deltaproteobacteria bacterium]